MKATFHWQNLTNFSQKEERIIYCGVFETSDTPQ